MIFSKVEKSPLKVEISLPKVEIGSTFCRFGQISEILVQKKMDRGFSEIFGNLGDFFSKWRIPT